VFNDTQSLAYFQLRLQKDGIMDMFKEHGVQDGDTMHFGALEYEIYF
jgi:Obg family GTPase CgtA-like protein